jgi:hypothetical protein
LRENSIVPPRTPLIDTRTYEQLVDEILDRIAVFAPEWTDRNESDPGITLIDLFAFVAESLLWHIDERKRQRRRRRRLAFLAVATAAVGVCLWRAGNDTRA